MGNKYEIRSVEDLLYNPVFNALSTRDAHFNLGKNGVKYFPEEVSPFAGFETGNEEGFAELHKQLPPGRKILYATPQETGEAEGWTLLQKISGIQFIYNHDPSTTPNNEVPTGEWGLGTGDWKLVPLSATHSQEMVALAALTKPGPFNMRTIEFGHYYGIFQDGRLAAMTGQRLHVNEYSEISAVCTHPDYLGRGYAAALIVHQLDIIHSSGEKAFLHVRDDNERAIALYKRLGFEVSRGMNFYFMERGS